MGNGVIFFEYFKDAASANDVNTLIIIDDSSSDNVGLGLQIISNGSTSLTSDEWSINCNILYPKSFANKIRKLVYNIRRDLQINHQGTN